VPEPRAPGGGTSSWRSAWSSVGGFIALIGVVMFVMLVAKR
jgi:hypothetical protein